MQEPADQNPMSDSAHDRELMKNWLANRPDTDSVAGFVAGPGIERLRLSF